MRRLSVHLKQLYTKVKVRQLKNENKIQQHNSELGTSLINLRHLTIQENNFKIIFV